MNEARSVATALPLQRLRQRCARLLWITRVQVPQACIARCFVSLDFRFNWMPSQTAGQRSVKFSC
jgi:hypothetical protein